MVGALFKEVVDIFFNKAYYQHGRSYVSLKYRHVHIHAFDNLFYKSMLHFPTGIRM